MILKLSELEAEALLQALDQFVMNCDDVEEMDKKLAAQQAAAERILELLNGRKAAMAEVAS